MILADIRIGWLFVFLKFFAQAFLFQFIEQLVPVVVIGSHSCLVHLADGSGALIDCRG